MSTLEEQRQGSVNPGNAKACRSAGQVRVRPSMLSHMHLLRYIILAKSGRGASIYEIEAAIESGMSMICLELARSFPRHERTCVRYANYLVLHHFS